MRIELETKNLIITHFEEDMAESVYECSLNADNRKFMPDEVFETVDIAKDVISNLRECYDGEGGPFVFPILLKNRGHIGHVEAIKIEEGWEIGYHIAEEHCGKGYATEAVRTFIPFVMKELGIDELYGICDAENKASQFVLEKNGFKKIFDGMGPYHGKDCHICKYVFQA